MALVDDIATYLTDVGVAGSGTGWPIVLTWMPARPNQVLAIFGTGGYASAAKTQLDYPTFQIRLRVADRSAAQRGAEHADTVYLTLDHVGPVTINGTSYRDIQAEQYPMPLGEDDSGRPEWAINFRCWRSR